MFGRKKKGGVPFAAAQPHMRLPVVAISCAFCKDPIVDGAERWFSLSKYEKKRWKSTVELHARCLDAYAQLEA